MAQSDEFTNGEKELLVKLLGAAVARYEKIRKASDEKGEKHIAAAASEQKAEADRLLKKIL